MLGNFLSHAGQSGVGDSEFGAVPVITVCANFSISERSDRYANHVHGLHDPLDCIIVAGAVRADVLESGIRHVGKRCRNEPAHLLRSRGAMTDGGVAVLDVVGEKRHHGFNVETGPAVQYSSKKLLIALQ